MICFTAVLTGFDWWSCSSFISISSWGGGLASGNTFHPINEVMLRRAGLVLGRVTALEHVNRLGM